MAWPIASIAFKALHTEQSTLLKKMNGPQRTANLAKGYIDSEFARCSAATIQVLRTRECE